MDELLPLVERITITEKRIANLQAGNGDHSASARDEEIRNAWYLLQELYAERDAGSAA